MKLLGSFSILLFFITSILSFILMYIHDNDYAYISSARFLEIVEDFPRDKVDDIFDSWKYFEENVKLYRWEQGDGFIENINRMINALGFAWISMFKSLGMFLIAVIGYAFDLLFWFISLPFSLLL